MKKRILSLLLTLLMLAGTVLLAQSVAASQFTDVSEKRWSYNDIMYTYGKGYMNGYPDGSFKPEESMSRAMIVTVLYRMEGEPEVTAKNPFGDVKSGKWYTDAVIWGADMGIVSGISKTQFGPEEKVTREQLVTFFARFAENVRSYDISKTADLSAYTDSGKISSYAKDYFAWAVATGLVNGKTATTLDPRGNATREQFAVILQRFDNTVFEYQLLYNEPQTISRYTEKEYPLVKDADIYVAVDGDDGNPGTLDRPVATFERAKEMVRGLKDNTDATADGKIVVAFKAGNYGNLNIEFTAEDSGTDELPIIYCAYGDGEVNFNNGISVTEEDFEPITEEEAETLFDPKYSSDIYKYDLKGKMTAEEVSSALLFNESGLLNLARYPDEGTLGNMISRYDGKYGHFETDRPITEAYILLPITKRFATYHDITEGRICGNLCFDFLFERLDILHYDKDTGYLAIEKSYYGLSADTPGTYWSHKPFYVENISEELTTEGEYYIDNDNMILYVYKPAGKYGIASKGTFVTCAEGASYITFKGLGFECTTGAAFDLDKDTDSITIELCNMYFVGAEYAVYLNGKNHKLLSSEIAYISGGGVKSLSPNWDYVSHEYLIEGEDWKNLNYSNKLIDNNLIHDIGMYYKDWHHGIHSSDIGCVISHNEIYNTPHIAIYPNGIDITVEYNVMYNCNTTVPDSGVIYTGRAYTRPGIKIRYNIISGGSGGYHIYLDDGMSGVSVYGNVFSGNSSTAIQVSGGRNNSIYENVFIKTNSSGSICQLWDKYISIIDKENFTISSATIGPLVDTLSILNGLSEEARARWEALAPWVFDLHTDYSKAESDPNCCVTPANNIMKDNYAIADHPDKVEFKSGQYNELYGTVENNQIFTPDENPLFVNPTLGDYRIRDDVDTSIIEKIPYIPYELIGRY